MPRMEISLLSLHMRNGKEKAVPVHIMEACREK